MPPGPNNIRRGELMDHIESIILSDGFSHLKVGALAAELRCSRSTLYKLAPSKDELMRLVFERYVQREIAAAARHAEEFSNPEDRISRFSNAIDKGQAKGSAQFWRDVRDTPTVRDIFTEGRAIGYRVIKTYLDQGVASGRFREANTEFAAHVLWIAAASTRDPDTLARLGVNREAAVQELTALIVHGMGKGTECWGDESTV